MRSPQVIDRTQLNVLVEILVKDHEVIGPVVQDNAICYEPISSASQIPWGFVDEQSAGKYRIRKGERNTAFSYVVGPHTWRRFLQPPKEKVWEVNKSDRSFIISKNSKPLAFFGVRACELEAIKIQDKVFIESEYLESSYASRRKSVFLVTVNCVSTADTCFCASMKTGPRVQGGFDLSLTELYDEKEHRFTIESGSSKGDLVLSQLNATKASLEDIEKVDSLLQKSSQSMKRRLETKGLPELLKNSLNSKRWDEIAERCLSCANCTLSCPTCFCHTVQDVTDLTAENSERWRSWDSCFNGDFSYVHGGNVRQSTKSRYRQWLTHKLGTWEEQFGTSGCVGCGRCITWCPTGIDLTEEIPKFVKEAT